MWEGSSIRLSNSMLLFDESNPSIRRWIVLKKNHLGRKDPTQPLIENLQ
jgi:hypothetical protein